MSQKIDAWFVLVIHDFMSQKNVSKSSCVLFGRTQPLELASKIFQVSLSFKAQHLHELQDGPIKLIFPYMLHKQHVNISMELFC